MIDAYLLPVIFARIQHHIHTFGENRELRIKKNPCTLFNPHLSMDENVQKFQCQTQKAKSQLCHSKVGV